MAQLPYSQTNSSDLNQIQTKWKAILDPVIAKVSASSSTASSAGSSSSSSFIGEVRSAFLTETQFQSQAGPGWVLCNGRNVAGSAYSSLTGNSTIPDMRATVPRMKDNGSGLDPAGDLTLGTYEADEFQGHYHSINDPTHNHTFTEYQTVGGGGNPQASATTSTPVTIPTSYAATGITVTAPTTDGTHGAPKTGSETRAKSTIINFFIRIN